MPDAKHGARRARELCLLAANASRVRTIARCARRGHARALDQNVQPCVADIEYAAISCRAPRDPDTLPTRTVALRTCARPSIARAAHRAALPSHNKSTRPMYDVFTAQTRLTGD